MASGDTLCVWHPQQGEAPSAAPATYDARNSRLVLDFDAAAEESILFKGLLPRHYAGGGVSIDLYGMATTAVTGDVKAGTSIERTEAGGTDGDADSFAAEQTGTVTCNGTSGVPFKATTTHSAGANMDSLVAGEPFRLKVARKAADAADTMAGDWELFTVEMRET